MGRRPLTEKDLSSLGKKFRRRKKKSTYQRTGKTARERDHHPKTDIEAMVKAKVLWLSSAGEMHHTKIAKAVGVHPLTIRNWRKKYAWDLEMDTIRKTVTDTMAESIATNPDTQYMLSPLPPEKIALAVNALIGKSMAEAIGTFLAHVHQQDLIDLAKINTAIRRHFKDIDNPDSHPLFPQSIKFLVDAKVAVMKAVRDIFAPVLGVPSDGKDGKAITISNQQIIEITLMGAPMESLNRLIGQKLIDVTHQPLFPQSMGKENDNNS